MVKKFILVHQRKEKNGGERNEVEGGVACKIRRGEREKTKKEEKN